MAGYKMLFRKSLGHIGQYFSMSKLIDKSHQNAICLLYHTIKTENSFHTNHLFHTKTIDELEWELDAVAGYFEFVTVEEFLKVKQDPSNNRRVCLLSFDDGLLECKTLIAPLLLKKQIPAIFFFNPEFAKGEKIFFRHLVSYTIAQINQKNHLTDQKKKELFAKLNLFKWSQENELKEFIFQLDNQIFAEFSKLKLFCSVEELLWLRSQGFALGLHTANHPLLTDLTLEEQIEQVRNGIELLQDERIKCFAFPFTDYGIRNDLMAVLEKLFDCSFGCAGLQTSSYKNHFQRIPMDDGSLGSIEKLKEEYLYYSLKKSIGK